MSDSNTGQPETRPAAIWNPNAAANWSLLFSPAFGSYLHMRNWRALGEPDKAATARVWFYASLALLIAYPVIGVVGGDTDGAKGLTRSLGLAFLLTWYFSAGRAQARYVKDKFGAAYDRNFVVAALIGVVLALLGLSAR
jgi:hypothetical protein